MVNRIRNATPRSQPQMGWPEALQEPPDTVVAKVRSERVLAQYRESEATKIIKANRGKPDEEIRAMLAAKGLEWPA